MGKERFPIYHILGSCDQTLELLYKVATAKRTSLRRINSTILTNNNNELLFPLKKANDHLVMIVYMRTRMMMIVP